MRHIKLIGLFVSFVILNGCSTRFYDSDKQNKVFDADLQTISNAASERDDSEPQVIAVLTQKEHSEAQFATEYREIPEFSPQVSQTAERSVDQPSFPDGEISVLIPPQPIPDFIDTVFGELLGLGYTLDPSVAGRQEIVTYRSAPNITRPKLFASAQAALEPYGVALTYEDGEVRAMLRDELLRQAPQFIRSRARANVPGNLRPVARYLELKSISVGDMERILTSVFPGGDDFRTLRLDQFGAIVLIGLPSIINECERIIAQMDRVRFEQSEVATVNIRNWELSELARTLENKLKVEGFAVSASPNVISTINLFPIEYTGQLVIFSHDRAMLEYTVSSAEQLDSSAQLEKDVRPFIYKAKFYEAGKLAEIITGQAMSRNSGTQTAAPAQPVASAQRSSGLGADDGAFAVNFTVDVNSNRLIYLATEEHHREISALLRAIDTPQDEVLIDVSIAEVTLNDATSYGMDFLMSQIGSQGYSIGVGTGGRIGLAAGGLGGSYSSGDYTVNFSALASNNQINLLSSPRIVVKSGSTGSIQVGTDVPIITSQAASNTQIAGNTDVLQSVEYRETGILLDITPLVLSRNRIDIEISQEVSSAEENANQAIASPVISNRQIQTELTLQDGQSAILGGLIENRYSRGTTGVPFVKDLPFIGNLFKTETLNSSRTMLLVMVTPYVLSSREDRSSSLSLMSEAMNEAFRNQVDESITLIKPNSPFNLETE